MHEGGAARSSPGDALRAGAAAAPAWRKEARRPPSSSRCVFSAALNETGLLGETGLLAALDAEQHDPGPADARSASQGAELAALDAASAQPAAASGGVEAHDRLLVSPVEMELADALCTSAHPGPGSRLPAGEGGEASGSTLALPPAASADVACAVA